jgi:hypothetical protein
VVRRGFVDEIRCSLLFWIKHGPQIVKRHPITRVELTDRSPVLSPARQVGDEWGWTQDPVSEVMSPDPALPVELWDLLPGAEVVRKWKWYPAKQSAIDAASEALLEWARSQS